MAHVQTVGASSDQGRSVGPELQPGAMPSTEGFNFYHCDTALDFVLRHRLSPEDYARAHPHLMALGGLAGRELAALADRANKNPPLLQRFDARGEQVDRVVFDPAYDAMRKIAFERFGLAAMTHRQGVLDWPGRPPQVLKYALGYLFSQAEFGLMCPISVTDHTARMLEHYADEELQRRYLPGLTACDLDSLLQGTMWLTERNGGSDVGATATVARRDEDGCWRLYGDKWFCSVADADVALTLARPEGAPAGTRGLAMFLVPRLLPNGSRNGLALARLKEKFGSRSIATGEVSFDGAVAYPVGPLGRGFQQMAEMINVSRLSNAMRAVGIMRRAYLESLTHARGRPAFGRPLIAFPLMRQTLLSMLLDVESGLAMVLHGAALLDRMDVGDGSARELLRLLTPLAKYHLCKQARWVASEAMDVRGGNGYIDDWPNARLVRDSYLGSIWEGTTTIVLLDCGRAMRREAAHEPFLADLQLRLESLRDVGTRRAAVPLARAVTGLSGRIERTLALDDAQYELRLGPLVDRMLHLHAAALLLEQADWQATEGSYRTLLLACVYLRRFLCPPLEDGLGLTAIERFEDLAGWQSLALEAALSVLAELAACADEMS